MLFPTVLFLLGSAAAFICLATLAFGDSNSTFRLPADEGALKQVAATIGKKDWDFSVDPCSEQNNWISPNADEDHTNAVNCNCSYVNNTVCHVVSIKLRLQNLAGTLPPELTKLPFLQEIDLNRNYLNGTIPIEWGSMQLVNISLLGNRISGPIPRELGNIGTLANLILDYNQLTGAIPLELGSLTFLETLSLRSNYLNGELPEQLGKLTALKNFTISDNQLVGSIPNFIGNWTLLEKLIIQASGLSGPIPSGISSLINLIDLRISDLNGNDSIFPDLSGATKLYRLILRNCNITGQLSYNLGSVPSTWTTSMKTLDLSFNKLTGPIPESWRILSDTDFIYLTGNFLSGPVPGWMLGGGKNIDLSYNNFTGNEISGSSCQPRYTNLFASSSKGRTSGIVSCLRNVSQCPPQGVHSLHINCGGRELKLKDGTYDDDMDPGGASNVFRGKSSWAFSSTGNFVDNIDTYIVSTPNTSATGNNQELYLSARVSPLSLTYYGFCLANGKYTVKLHFAEIVFRDDTTYASLGRRFFDIYIQGELVEKDFNIEMAAGGVGKPIVVPFTAVVNDSTLEIRFYWAGKGTNTIPLQAAGEYGPLISAISVDHIGHGNSLPVGAVVGIVVAVLFIISAVLVILYWKGCLRRKDSMDKDLRSLDLRTGTFTLRQIKAATNNFDASNKIGEGGFGSVYKGHLRDGTIIAVKQLSSKSKQGNREFVNEIGMISALQHPNLVKLYGCCIEGNQLLLIYEYMENNNLARALFGPEEHQLELDWPKRHAIAVGIARGLAYLHEESRLKIVHRDIKATNVLLDKNLNPKISDFGLAKLHDQDNTHISTRIAGTFGYMAPEYAMRGYLTDKADVYSYGIVLLEIVSGMCNTSVKAKHERFYLLDQANLLKKEGKLMELIDPRLGSDYNAEIILTVDIALLCTDATATNRPNMSSVVSILEGQRVLAERSVSGPSVSNKNKFKVANSNGRDEIQVSVEDVPTTTSSTAARDLYPFYLDSDYILKR